MKRIILLISFILTGLFSIILYQKVTFEDGKLHVIFCDVGQGDAIFITYNALQMLVDGGPDTKVLSCIERHMPFWDRNIEIMLLTHPQLDHFGGFIDVIKQYKIDNFARPQVQGETAEWKAFNDEIQNRAIPHRKTKAGDRIRYGNLQFNIINPEEGFSGFDLNNYSVVGTLTYGEFDVLLTGDIMPPAIDLLVPKMYGEIEVLKVPHHGSKNGLTIGFLEKADPSVAVISSSANNRYGHPHEEILRLLGDRGVRILRTDEDGEIEIISDGKSWWIR